MTIHWCEKYIGGKWTPQHDCGWWFRFWSLKEFERNIPPIIVNHETPLVASAKMMTGDIKKRYGFQPIEYKNQAEGDAVFLSQRLRPHHIGMAVFVDNEWQVLHALENIGVVLSNNLNLMQNGWKLVGIYGYLG